MKSNYIMSKLNYLDSLFTYFSASKFDTGLESHIAQYLTVLTSGLYEDITKRLVLEFVERNTNKNELKIFIFKKVSFFRNPDFQNLEGLLNQFDKNWIGKLEQNFILDGTLEIRKDALNSIVANKNKIAHGESSTITFQDIKIFYESSKPIFIMLDDIIL